MEVLLVMSFWSARSPCRQRTTLVIWAVNLLLISSTEGEPCSSQDSSLMVQPASCTSTDTVITGSMDQLKNFSCPT
jgi:hypothetical protein